MGPGALLELHHCVGLHALQHPTAIFRGILRDEDDDRSDTDGWICYASLPSYRYSYASGDQIPRDDRVLLAFVNEEFVNYHHRWEPQDPERAGFPCDHDTRFKEHLL